MKNKIILGTANFSNKYGLINKQKIKQNSLLKCANKFGIKFLDTSPLYGKAEKKIGRSKIKFQIITKIPKITNKWTSPRSWVLKSISSTQKNVKQKKSDTKIDQTKQHDRSKVGRSEAKSAPTLRFSMCEQRR